ncbi:MAG: DNA repair exonuclease [Proteobacteria bacterium]|nr:DNA repair exonuclease [Pseudomonadota bacterium]
MAFAFLHTADWQIGKTFRGFAPDVAAVLRLARLEAIDRLAEAAMAEQVRHVLVAGDVIDSELMPDRDLREPLTRMARYGGLVWHLIAGNHDPARPRGVWERMCQLGLPANVLAHLMPAPAEIAAGVVLLPAPLAAKQMASDPTSWMDGAASPEGALRIGLAHGSVQGFGSLGEAPVPIDPKRRRSAGLDYLALGDWHGTKEIAEGVWYSGTPEPDSFAENNPGNALVVRIAGLGAAAEAKIVRTAKLSWLERRIAMARLEDLGPIEAEIAALGPEARHAVISLKLEGALPARDVARLEARLAGLGSGLTSFEADRSRLRLGIETSDIAALGDPALERIAATLKSRSASADPTEARLSGRAMQMLLALAAEGAPEEAA